MKRGLGLEDSSIRRLALAEFVGSFNVLLPVLSLFYVHRGLRLDEVLSLILAWVLTSLVSEVLTGAFADRFGCRASFLAGSVVGALQFVALYFAHGFWTFALASVLGALGFAFFSGSDQAYVYERMLSSGRQQEFARVWGRVQSAKIYPTILATIFGALIARELSESAFAVLLAVGFASSLLKIALIAGLRDAQPSAGAVRSGLWGTLRGGWQQVSGSRALLWLFLHETLLLVPTHVMLSDYNMAQPLLVESGAEVAMLGPLYTGMSLCSLAALTWGPDILRKLGAKLFLLGTAAAMVAIWVTWLIAERSTALLMAGMLLLRLLLFARLVACSQLKNEMIESGSRATVLSFLATADSAFDIVLLGSLGFAARRGYEPIFYGCTLVSLAGVACGAGYLHLLRGARRWPEPSCGT